MRRWEVYQVLLVCNPKLKATLRNLGMMVTRVHAPYSGVRILWYFLGAVACIYSKDA